MSRYNLDGFPPNEFQRFCGSLIRSVRGEEIHPFTHKGLDGGIDAYSYDRREIYQIKHHQVSYVGTRSANSIVAKEFEKELKSLIRRYNLDIRSFTFVTNVRLYPKTVERILEKAKEVAPDTKCQVWDCGVIESMLDHNASIREAWFEQLGDVVKELSDKVEDLGKATIQMSQAERSLRQFLEILPKPKTDFDEQGLGDLKTIEDAHEGDLAGRLQVARLLRDKKGDTVLTFLLDYFMVDRSLLSAFPVIAEVSDEMRECLAEITKSIVSCGTKAAVLFATGCIAHPFIDENGKRDPASAVCQEAALEQLRVMDQDWFAEEFVALYGASKAEWIWEFLTFHIQQSLPEYFAFMHQIRSRVHGYRATSVELPCAKEVYETIVYGYWIGEDRLVLSPGVRDKITESFRRNLHALENERNLSKPQRIDVAIILLMEQIFGITPYHCDFSEGSKYHKLLETIRNEVLLYEVAKEIKEIVGIDDEEFKSRSNFTNAINTFKFQMFHEGLKLTEIPFKQYSKSAFAKRIHDGGENRVRVIF